MSPIKVGCIFTPLTCRKPQPRRPDWEMHPSWITGMEALEDYNNWVNDIVLPIAFQWIEEHKPEVYASVPEKFRDDVGVVIAAAFKLVRELPAHKEGLEKCEAYETALDKGTWDPSNTNPVWTGISRKIRAETKEAFAEQAPVLDDTIPKE